MTGADHPGEAMLVKHLDGELGANDALRLQVHVEACRSCRAKTDRMRKAIGAFVEFYDGPFTDAVKAGLEGRR